MLIEQDFRDTATAEKYLAAGQKALESGDRVKAIEAYQAAYTADPDHAEVCFHLAYNLDLVGEEDEALRLYEYCSDHDRPALSALLNLAVLYEDREQYLKAERCLRQVLATDPNHPRARLYLKDVVASKGMVVDDDQQKRFEKQAAMLETPVSDFDLSVKTRNSLRKIEVRTLGDLLRITETELRNFKNLGDGSIEEIKAMLAQRGLHLGEAVEQQKSAIKQAVYDQIKSNTGTDESMLNRPVGDLDLSVRARKALALLNIRTIGELCMRTEAELMGVKNFGTTSLLEIKEKLTGIGLGLRTLE